MKLTNLHIKRYKVGCIKVLFSSIVQPKQEAQICSDFSLSLYRDKGISRFLKGNHQPPLGFFPLLVLICHGFAYHLSLQCPHRQTPASLWLQDVTLTLLFLFISLHMSSSFPVFLSISILCPLFSVPLFSLYRL